jgi:hypothetical protein
MTVNPTGQERGLAFIYNPLEVDIDRKIRLPLYYTGLTRQARVTIEGQPPQVESLESDATVTLDLTIPARGRRWVLIEQEGEATR